MAADNKTTDAKAWGETATYCHKKLINCMSKVVYFSNISVKTWVDKKVNVQKVDVEVLNGCVIQLVVTSLPGLLLAHASCLPFTEIGTKSHKSFFGLEGIIAEREDPKPLDNDRYLQCYTLSSITGGHAVDLTMFGDANKLSRGDHVRLPKVMLDREYSALKCSDSSSAEIVRRGCTVPTTLTPVALPSK